MLTVLLGAILFATVAMLINEGLWSNIITLLNVILAALIATSFFEPVADFLESQMPGFTYAVDFIALWLLYTVSMLVLRGMTDSLSRVQVRFPNQANTIGAGVVGLLAGWVLVGFTAMTFHTAPLARDFMPKPTEKTFVIASPDLQWMGFVQQLSRGALSTSAGNTFDPQRAFVYRYGQRRADFEQHPSFTTE